MCILKGYYKETEKEGEEFCPYYHCHNPQIWFRLTQ